MPGTGNEGSIPAGSFTPNFPVRANGNVGVGTGTPTSTLQVNGSVAASRRALDSGTITTDTADATVLVTASVSRPPAPPSSAAATSRSAATPAAPTTGPLRDAGTRSTCGSFSLGRGTGTQGLPVRRAGAQWWILTRE